MEQLQFDRIQKNFRSFLTENIDPTPVSAVAFTPEPTFVFTKNLIGKRVKNIEVRVKSLNEIEQTFGFLNEDASLGNKVILEDATGTKMMVNDYKGQFNFGKCYRLNATICSMNPQIRLSDIQITETF